MPRAFLNPDPALLEREYSMTEQRLSIAEEQAEFINDFNEIDDWMMQYSCLLELTADMKPVSDEEKNEQNKISGCQADLWIILSFENGIVHVRADSDSLIVKGIVAVIAALFDKRTPQEICGAHIDFLEKTIGKIPETISCRYNPGGIFKISNDIMDNPGDSKYGMTTEQITEAFKTLKAKGAKEFGIHAFLASNTVTNDYYPMLAKVLFEQAVRLQKETGVHIKFINLSGGIGIPYTPDQEPNDIRVIGEGVRKVYEEVLVPAGMGDVAIYTELGRFMMGPYGCLVTKAIHEKNTYKNYIGVDACAVNLMRPAMYGAYHHITVLGKEDAPCDHKYDVTGSLCENNDKFAIDRMLPEVDMGDYLVIHDTGAHGFSMGYNYNGKLKSAELLLKEDGSVQMIRRAETPKDYFATFDCFEVGKKLCK